MSYDERSYAAGKQEGENSANARLAAAIHDANTWETTAESARAETRKIRADAATVVRALDAALQWGEALFVFLPEGQTLTSGVSTAKIALDDAMAMMRRPNIEQVADAERLQTALNVACASIAELNDRCALISKKASETANALAASIMLSDQLLDYLRRDGQPAPMAIIAAHNRLQQTIQTLLEKE